MTVKLIRGEIVDMPAQASMGSEFIALGDKSGRQATILLGDVLDRLRILPDDSVDSIVTDPPYELGFMGKAWDKSGIAVSVPMWRECLRVLKPGGHLLSFGGSRTYHRMACAIEDAGFEIRDQIMWLYGSGFPKSLDVSKAIDKAARGVPQGGADLTSENHGNYKSGCSEDNPSGRGFGAGPGQFMKDSRSKYDGANRTAARSTSSGFGYESKGGLSESQPLTESAQEWVGYGTALKPAHEPICVARKPIEGTVAANVLKYGTGALNIDGCRIEGEKPGHGPRPDMRGGNYNNARIGEVSAERTYTDNGATNFAALPGPRGGSHLGRWPANVIHDGSEEVVELFPVEAGAQAPVTTRNGDKFRTAYGEFAGNVDEAGSTFQGDSGSAARFFYVAKASREERNSGCYHIAEKPLIWSSGEQSPGTFQAEGTQTRRPDALPGPAGHAA
jgi:hypothetical protein